MAGKCGSESAVLLKERRKRFPNCRNEKTNAEIGKIAEEKWFFFTKRTFLSIILAENCSREKDF
jgi:hypothetical protein